MRRMAEVVAIRQGVKLIEDDIDDFERSPSDSYSQRTNLPDGVEVFQLRGPLFFGAAYRLNDVLDRIGATPRIFILRMREVPMIDASGVAALQEFVRRCASFGTQVIVTGVQLQPRRILEDMGAVQGGAIEGGGSEGNAVLIFAEKSGRSDPPSRARLDSNYQGNTTSNNCWP